ncbi:MAG TPA: hypothetical protein VHI77_07510 [Solirubrobacterales bacterium]|nr:hypothetical protein [Solirubrobacterales bacterium]
MAVLGVSAVTAAAALALNWTATNGKYPTTVTGGQAEQFEFKMGPRVVTCSIGSFEAKLEEKSFVLTTTPKFEKCKADGGLGATFKWNGCDFGLTAPVLAQGALIISCPINAELEVNIYSSESAEGEGKMPVCRFKFAAQTPREVIVWTNEGVGNASQVKGEFAVKPKYTTAGSEEICGEAGTAEFLGQSIFKGKFGEVAEGVDVG